MTVTAKKPAAGVFGYETPNDIDANKNLLQQCVAGLTGNAIPVTLPGTFPSPGLSTSDGRAGDPISLEKELVKNLMAALAGANAKAAITLVSSAPANVVVFTALQVGNYGNSITVTVAAGTSSGKKITIAATGAVTEVYDNVTATGNAFVTAVNGVSLIVSAAIASGGGALVPANLAATALTGGVGAVVTPPVYDVSSPDDASVSVRKWGLAIFKALQANGYIA